MLTRNLVHATALSSGFDVALIRIQRNRTGGSCSPSAMGQIIAKRSNFLPLRTARQYRAIGKKKEVALRAFGVAIALGEHDPPAPF